MEIRFLSVRKAESRNPVWDVRESDLVLRQDSVPLDDKLGIKLEKAGIKRGSKILVFAGCYGDWADALAKHHDVSYTDLSKSMSEYVRRRFPHLRQISGRNALFTPSLPNHFDYSFSFEPIPMYSDSAHPGLQFALAGSLLNRKGAFLLEWHRYHGARDAFKLVRALYGAKLKMTSIGIDSLRRSATENSGPRIKPLYHSLYVLHTTPSARKKAEIDRRVIIELNRGAGKDSEVAHFSFNELHEKLAKHNVSKAGLLQSLKRINALSTISGNFGSRITSTAIIER